MVWMWVAGTWLVLAVCVALVVARSIRLADRRSPQAPTERNFVVDCNPLEAPVPPAPRFAADTRLPEWPPTASALPPVERL
jgi:hypothetical protein